MSRKHFQALADALRWTRPDEADYTERTTYVQAFGVWRRSVVAVADVCYASNGRFDRERFYRAAGYER